MARVCVALSGGVDSAVAAALLLREGHQVEGVTMDTGYLSLDGAMEVAEHLRIPLRVVDLRREFEELVVRPTVEHYLGLVTPNPCAWCNLRLKFGALLHAALQGAELYATGHYACLERQDQGVVLRESLSPGTPSQAYFLALVPSRRLERVLFPMCGRSKDEARALAGSLGIPVQGGKSRDLCFLPQGGLASLLEERGVNNPVGRVVDTSGRVLGRHRGLYLYTIGQRRGIGAGGTTFRRYVVGHRAQGAELIVGPLNEVLSNEVRVVSPNWISSPPRRGEVLTLRLRYRQRGIPAEVLSVDEQGVRVRLGISAVAVPSQVAVFNRGDEVVGGGEIEKPLPVG